MSETTNLKLFKHDSPATNTNLFDVERALNENWDKIDEDSTKRTYYYNNVQEMKEDEKLKEGMICQTLGYYEENDGGAGLYKIIDDETLEDDGGLVHELENGLKATLIYEKNPQNIQKFGCKTGSNFDNSQIIQNMLNLGIKLYIPRGIWYMENIQVPTGSVIIGDYSFSPSSTQNSVVHSITGSPCLIFGNGINPSISNYIKNINITGSGVSGSCLLHLNYTYFNVFENIVISNFAGGAIKFNGCWETVFNNLICRQLWDYTIPALVFDTPEQNHSAIYFDTVNFEACLGGCIDCKSTSVCADITFDNIFYEEGLLRSASGITQTSQTTLSNDGISIPLFKINRASNLAINNITCINIGNAYYTINNTKYEHKTILEVAGYVEYNIGNIQIAQTNETLIGITVIKASGKPTWRAPQMINNIQSRNSYNLDINISTSLKINNLLKNTNVLQYQGTLAYVTTEQTLFNRLSVKNSDGGTVLASVPSYNGKTYSITAYVPTGTTWYCRTRGTKNGTPSTSINRANITGDNNWHTVNFTNDFDDNTTFSFITSNDVNVIYNALSF